MNEEKTLYVPSQKKDGGDTMKNVQELVEKIVSDAEFRREFLQNSRKVLDEYGIKIGDEELEKLKDLGDIESEELSKELSQRLSKSCSWQT